MQAFNHNKERGTQDFELVLVGHSLGAGTASILAILLRQDYPTLQCFAYSPPGGSLRQERTLKCEYGGVKLSILGNENHSADIFVALLVYKARGMVSKLSKLTSLISVTPLNFIPCCLTVVLMIVRLLPYIFQHVRIICATAFMIYSLMFCTFQSVSSSKMYLIVFPKRSAEQLFQ